MSKVKEFRWYFKVEIGEDRELRYYVTDSENTNRNGNWYIVDIDENGDAFHGLITVDAAYIISNHDGKLFDNMNEVIERYNVTGKVRKLVLDTANDVVEDASFYMIDEDNIITVSELTSDCDCCDEDEDEDQEDEDEDQEDILDTIFGNMNDTFSKVFGSGASNSNLFKNIKVKFKDEDKGIDVQNINHLMKIIKEQLGS